MLQKMPSSKSAADATDWRGLINRLEDIQRDVGEPEKRADKTPCDLAMENVKRSAFGME